MMFNNMNLLKLAAIAFIGASPTIAFGVVVDADEQKNSVAYSTVSKRFLCVYMESTQQQTDIVGQLTDDDGVPLGDVFVISDKPRRQLKPVVAYSDNLDAFLVVWLDYREVGNIDIYAQLVSSQGVLAGDEVLVSQNPGDDKRPAVAYDSVNDRFLICWSAFAGIRADVHAQFVTEAATRLGDNFVVASDVKDQFKPAVAFSPSSQNYLVVWQDRRNQDVSGDDIYGQFIDASGAAQGGNFVISNGPDAEWRPEIAYNSVQQTFLVVWMNNNRAAADIYGSLISATGEVTQPLIPIAINSGGQVKPSVAFAPKQNAFLVAFMVSNLSGIQGANIHGQFIHGDGSLLRDQFEISSAKKVQHRPDVAASGGKFMVIWTDFRFRIGKDESLYELYGRIVAPEMPLTARLVP